LSFFYLIIQLLPTKRTYYNFHHDISSPILRLLFGIVVM